MRIKVVLVLAVMAILLGVLAGFAFYELTNWNALDCERSGYGTYVRNEDDGLWYNQYGQYIRSETVDKTVGLNGCRRTIDYGWE